MLWKSQIFCDGDCIIDGPSPFAGQTRGHKSSLYIIVGILDELSSQKQQFGVGLTWPPCSICQAVSCWIMWCDSTCTPTFLTLDSLFLATTMHLKTKSMVVFRLGSTPHYWTQVKNHVLGAPAWLSQLSVWLLVLAQVRISQFCEFKPCMELCTDSTKPAWDSFSLPFSLPLPNSCCLSLSK